MLLLISKWCPCELARHLVSCNLQTQETPSLVQQEHIKDRKHAASYAPLGFSFFAFVVSCFESYPVLPLAALRAPDRAEKQGWIAEGECAMEGRMAEGEGVGERARRAAHLAKRSVPPRSWVRTRPSATHEARLASLPLGGWNRALLVWGGREGGWAVRGEGGGGLADRGADSEGPVGRG